ADLRLNLVEIPSSLRTLQMSSSMMRGAESSEILDCIRPPFLYGDDVMDLDPSGLRASLPIGERLRASPLVSEIDLVKQCRCRWRTSKGWMCRLLANLSRDECRRTQDF